MIEKKVKIEVPKTVECSRCKDIAKVNDLKLTHKGHNSNKLFCYTISVPNGTSH